MINTKSENKRFKARVSRVLDMHYLFIYFISMDIFIFNEFHRRPFVKDTNQENPLASILDGVASPTNHFSSIIKQIPDPTARSSMTHYITLSHYHDMAVSCQ